MGEIYLPDGVNVVEGSTADAKIIGDSSGTISGKLRGITTILAAFWNPATSLLRTISVEGVLRITQTPAAGYPGLHYKISEASTNVTHVRGSATQVGALIFSNKHATDWRYVKFFNKAATPDVGRDNPILIFAIAPNSVIAIQPFAGFVFSLGLGYAITALPAGLDDTAIGADEVIVNIIHS